MTRRDGESEMTWCRQAICRRQRVLVIDRQTSWPPVTGSNWAEIYSNRQRNCAENYNEQHDKFTFFKLQSAFWWFRTTTVSECCLIELFRYILFEKYIYIFVLEIAGPGIQHCANCIGTLSFPVVTFSYRVKLSGNEQQSTSSRHH